MAGGVDRGAADALADELMLSFGFDDEDDLDDELDELDELDDEQENFGFGGKSEGRVERAAKTRSGGLATLLGTLSQGVVQSMPPDQLLAMLWPQSQSQSLVPTPLPLPPSLQPAQLVPAVRPSPPPQVEADSSSLPPVYVADRTGVENVRQSAEGKISSEPLLAPSDIFGASFDYGLVRTRPSDKDRVAMVRAKLGSTKMLADAGRSTPAPFLEDPGALPMLLSDGRVVEPSYGLLGFAPCPSCCRASSESYGRTGNGCVVCDDWGALLVPATDLAAWRSAERYGFEAAKVSYGIIPLLIALAPAAVPLIGAAGMKGAASKQARDAMAQSRAASVRARLRKEIEGIDDQAVAVATSAQAPVTEEVSGLDFDEDELLVDDEDSFGDSGEGLEEDDFLGDDLDDDDDLDDLLDDEDDDTDEPAVARMLIPHGRR